MHTLLSQERTSRQLRKPIATVSQQSGARKEPIFAPTASLQPCRVNQVDVRESGRNVVSDIIEKKTESRQKCPMEETPGLNILATRRAICRWICLH